MRKKESRRKKRKERRKRKEKKGADLVDDSKRGLFCGDQFIHEQMGASLVPRREHVTAHGSNQGVDARGPLANIDTRQTSDEVDVVNTEDAPSTAYSNQIAML